MVLPKSMPELKGREAERFMEYDRMPLTEDERRARARSTKVYNSILPRRRKK